MATKAMFKDFDDKDLPIFKEQILPRAKALFKSANVDFNKLSFTMDMGAAHQDVGLNLEKLAGFDDASFGHDIFGIRRYMDRETGQLTNCFLPRCAA